ncbi:MAG TPA: hypothetical protein VH062_15380 [Polyangiaceae bacterium]|jgi:hypothetical protein|nr:hypothetical protein [Polyangiaceae bacterium]
MNDMTPWIVLALGAVALIVVAATVMRNRVRTRRVALQRKFGPEYDRVVVEHGDLTQAERELAARASRVQKFHFRDLTDDERRTFGDAWSRLQAQFVDDPEGAAIGADNLIGDVMRARGYPVEDFEHQAADLSVDHAEVVQHYRAAQALTHSDHVDGPLHTEDLRQAVVHYRALFTDLVQAPRPFHSMH